MPGHASFVERLKAKLQRPIYVRCAKRKIRLLKSQKRFL
jgi:hypothetical protein